LQNSALTTIFENLKKTTTRDNARQIEEAIGSSETLRVKINELAEANLFSGFKVAPRAMLKKKMDALAYLADSSKVVRLSSVPNF